MKISVVIPTFGREQVLIDTIRSLLVLEETADELIVVDQTANHMSQTADQLRTWNNEGKIVWVKREIPSTTKAMNQGLCLAKNPLVLFVDDDIVPREGLVRNHIEAHMSGKDCWVTAGQVIQPWQKPESLQATSAQTGLKLDLDFPFNTTLEGHVSNVIGCNFCVNRQRALSIGGFDENYIGSAFRFETDFAKRVVAAGGSIRFVPSASIDHLRYKEGGTRSKGNHLASASPLHGFGDYYYAFKLGKPREAWIYSLQRFFREVRTRFHLTHPWWIPVKMLGEARAISMAIKTRKAGPQYIDRNDFV